MDSDRKSTVSSFYGRKNSMDALNSDFPSPGTPNSQQQHQHRGHDDASSFYNQDSKNVDNGRPGAAGYNRNSFFFAGREEPVKGGRDEEERGGNGGAWDIYADFNNAGPKYSTGFGGGNDGYQPLPPQGHSPGPKSDTASSVAPVELVTVPALGPEWKKEELENMTKRSRKAKKAEARSEKLKEWNRGKRGFCGGWLTRKVFAISMFAACVVIGITLAFVIPRVPKFAFSASGALVAATGDWKDAVPLTFARAPANFSFSAFADLEVDTTDSFVPLKFNPLHAEVYDSQTNRKVAEAEMKITLPPKQFNKLLLPLNFTYIASNDSDRTWQNYYNACKNKGAAPDGVRDGLSFRLILQSSIFGLPYKSTTSTSITNAACPIELAMNAA